MVKRNVKAKPARATESKKSKASGRGKLFLSFWDIGLENLPEGAFVRRRIVPQSARRAIEEGRRERRLMCVSHDDLFAPYRGHERKRHDDLRRVLKKHFAITLTLRDFTSSDDDDGGNSDCFINPLACVQVRGRDRLLVVTCAFTLRKASKEKGPSFAIAPDTVEFHLFAAAGRIRRANS